MSEEVFELGGVVGRRLLCPRCGRVLSWIESQHRGGNTYYYAIHYMGSYRDSRGRVRKKVKRCYLGPYSYIYVTQLHRDLNLILRGAVDSNRAFYYLDAFVDAILGMELDKSTMIEIASKLERLARVIRSYVEKGGREKVFRAQSKERDTKDIQGDKSTPS